MDSSLTCNNYCATRTPCSCFRWFSTSHWKASARLPSRILGDAVLRESVAQTSAGASLHPSTRCRSVCAKAICSRVTPYACLSRRAELLHIQ